MTTIGELQEKIARSIRSGAITEDDEVMLRDPSVSEGAISAGSSPWTALDNVLIIREGVSDLVAGIYLEPEEH